IHTSPSYITPPTPPTSPLPLHDALPIFALTRACFESLRASREPFRLVVIDNGSTDGTAEFFARFPYPYPLRFERNAANQSVLATDRKSTRLNSSHQIISYAVFCLKIKN